MDLPIPQLPGFLLTVADSTLPGAGKGLFTLQRIEVDDYLCSYDGKRLSKEDLPRPLGPENDYIWSNRGESVIIDAFHHLSCFGRYANDALYDHKCSAMIIMHKGKVKLRATRDILPNEEIFVHYGGGYWADRFHTLGDSSSPLQLSSLQRSILDAYSLLLLPNGKALQRNDLDTPISFAITVQGLMEAPWLDHASDTVYLIGERSTDTPRIDADAWLTFTNKLPKSHPLPGITALQLVYIYDPPREIKSHCKDGQQSQQASQLSECCPISRSTPPAATQPGS